MKVQLDIIGDDGYDLDRQFEKEWLIDALGKDAAWTPSVLGKLQVHISRVEDIFHLQGTMGGEFSAKCSRCLADVTLNIHPNLSLTLLPKGKKHEVGKDVELDIDDMSIDVYEGKTIDLSNFVRDELLLELPLKPLCSESCAGLCSSCGTNLNNGPCSCEPPADPRWSALKEIKLN
ncbi:DUF177 domain-containing protein [Myxococcota bacterium]|nr:DUF177 domain-containing protein [Myxococcota bacterium]